MIVGTALPADKRKVTLEQLHVPARVSDGRRAHGIGANVLGDPVDALVWLDNEICGQGQVFEAGQFVTTGACVAPVPVQPGDLVSADFDWLGTVRERFE
jgi:2-keto-4-pentenoate hydratase